jgi:ABC-2 type transport system ATP-binding protein
MSLIEVAALTVRYGGRTALDDVSLAVPEGSVYALLGRNGAGKSSLMRCLLGAQKPAAGSIRLLGRDAWRHRASILPEVGVVPEEPDAPPAMTARQIARFCSRLYPRWDAAGVDERLRRFGVPLDVPFGRLSKGQKGQVSLTLALAPAPRLVLLDDPTLGLDPLARRAEFEELIVDLADRGTTVFLTSHDLAGVEGIADRVGVLRDGRLVLDEDLESVKQRFRRIRFPASAGPPAGLEALAPLAVASRGWGVEAVVAGWDEERRALPESALPRGAEVSALTLEEIFLAVVDPAAGGHP